MLFNGILIKEKEWLKCIDSISIGYEYLEKSKKKIKEMLKELIIQAIKERVSDRFGVLFSGGIDSSLIALISKKLKCNFICYTVGLKGCEDLIYAKRVADRLGFDLRLEEISLEELQDILRKVLRLLKEPDVVKVGVGCVFYKALELVREDKIKEVFSGLGSEEIFAGYQRHLEAFKSKDWEGVHKECFAGLKSIYKRDLIRDFLVAKDRKVTLKLPFLDKSVIEYAMKIHPMYKINNHNNKIILREIGEELGLGEFAWRKKKAAQYGSGFHKGLRKLAKRNRYKYIKEYLAGLSYYD